LSIVSGCWGLRIVCGRVRHNGGGPGGHTAPCLRHGGHLDWRTSSTLSPKEGRIGEAQTRMGGYSVNGGESTGRGEIAPETSS
jgi:hypothetical protein